MTKFKQFSFGTALILSMAVFFVSCGGEDDTDGLSIEIQSPTEGATFAQSDTIDLSYTVTDDVDISTIAYFNVILGTGSVAAAELSGDNDTSYSGTFSFSANVEPREYTITMTATGETTSDVVEKSVTVNIQ